MVMLAIMIATRQILGELFQRGQFWLKPILQSLLAIGYRRARDFFSFTSMLIRLPPVRPPTIERMNHPPPCGA